uniref:Protein transport protein SEC23 n=1 Tax=Arundo donax TaxID=35708 RepID=A0A0A9D8W6_ARUDO
MAPSDAAFAVRSSTLSPLLISLQRFGSVHSAFSATISPNTTLLFRKTTSLQNYFLNIPPLSMYPLLKQVVCCLQSSSLLSTCMVEEEIGYLKSALAQAIELLPDQSLVGFITFGTYVQVHELGFGLLPKSYVFKGTKEVTKEQILEQMCFSSGKTKPTTGVIAGPRDGLSAESVARFLLPASECYRRTAKGSLACSS